MAIKVNGTTVIDDSSNVCANSVCACCVEASSTVTIPSGNTAGRPTGAVGELYFDTDEGKLIAHDGTDWAVTGGGATIHPYYATTGSWRSFEYTGGCSLCSVEGCAASNITLSPNGSYTAATQVNDKKVCLVGGGETCLAQFLYGKNGVNGDSYVFGVGACNDGYYNECCKHQYAYVGYCGICDTGEEATPMFLQGKCCCYTPNFQREGYFKYKTNAPLTTTNSNSYNNIRNNLFVATGKGFNEQCNGYESYGDACCGVIASLQFTICCSQSNNRQCGHLKVVLGFNPCYYYDSTYTTTAAASPMKTFIMCGSFIGCGYYHRATIDWCNKRIWTISHANANTQAINVAIWCLCDSSYPDCQACWYVPTTPICGYVHCSSLNCVYNTVSSGSAVAYNNKLYTMDNLFITVWHCNCGTKVCQLRLKTCYAGTCSYQYSPTYMYRDKDGCFRVGFQAWLTGIGTSCKATKYSELVWSNPDQMICCQPVDIQEYGFYGNISGFANSCTENFNHSIYKKCHQHCFEYEPVTDRFVLKGITISKSTAASTMYMSAVLKRPSVNQAGSRLANPIHIPYCFCRRNMNSCKANYIPFTSVASAACFDACLCGSCCRFGICPSCCNCCQYNCSFSATAYDGQGIPVCSGMTCLCNFGYAPTITDNIYVQYCGVHGVKPTEYRLCNFDA